MNQFIVRYLGKDVPFQDLLKGRNLSENDVSIIRNRIRRGWNAETAFDRPIDPDAGCKKVYYKNVLTGEIGECRSGRECAAKLGLKFKQMSSYIQYGRLANGRWLLSFTDDFQKEEEEIKIIYPAPIMPIPQPWDGVETVGRNSLKQNR